MTLLTVEEVCEKLKISRKTLYTIRQKGEIPEMDVEGLVRFSEEAINDYLKSKTKKK